MTPLWISCAVVFFLPMVTPRGKWFLWSTFGVGAAIVVIWAQHIYVTSRPDYAGSVDSSVGAALMLCFTVAWILGLAVRYVVWLVQLKREERLEKRQGSSW